MWVYIRMHARTYAYARALSPAHTHTQTHRQHHTSIRLRCSHRTYNVFIYIMHPRTFPRYLAVLALFTTGERTRARTRTHAHTCPERERKREQSRLKAMLARTYMCPHTTICVRILRYVCLSAGSKWCWQLSQFDVVLLFCVSPHTRTTCNVSSYSHLSLYMCPRSRLKAVLAAVGL